MAERRYVLDTVVFIVGIPVSMTDQLYTVPGVLDELRGKLDKQRFEYLRDAGLTVKAPTPESISVIEEHSSKTGDAARLSDVDKSLIALTLDLNAVLVTDDYSLQNLASELEIQYQAVGERGIKEIFTWELKCAGCARIWDQPHRVCPVCGTKLKSSRKK